MANSDSCPHMIWAYFVLVNFQHTKIREKKRQKKSSVFLDMFCSLFVFQPRIFSMPSSGFQWHVCKFHNLTLPWCWFLYCSNVVSMQNFWAVQSETCISTAKYEHWPFFWKPCWYFQIVFTEIESKMKWKYMKILVTFYLFFKVYSCLYGSGNGCAYCPHKQHDDF